MSLLKYIIRRLLALIPILIGVLLLTFILTRKMPGNPYLISLQGGARSPAQQAVYEANVERLGLDQNPIPQFLKYLKLLFTGDWGKSISIFKGEKVWDIIKLKFPRTVEITFLSLTFASFIGIKAGIISAVNRNKPKDTIIRFIALAGVATPVFWMGMLFQYVFSARLGWLPGGGYFGQTYPLFPRVHITGLRLIDSLLGGEINLFLDTVRHLLMPVFCLTFISLAGFTRQQRSSMLEVLELDYIRTARAKGCSENDVINKHAFKNALIPIITLIGLSFASLLGGAVLTETTFNLNGMGRLTIDAINAVDYFVINGCVFLITVVFVLVNLIVDIIYGIVDPRIRI